MNEEEIQEALLRYAIRRFPRGCKFFQDDGTLSMGGEIIAAMMLQKEFEEHKAQSPCNGCNFNDCEVRGGVPAPAVAVFDLDEIARQETARVSEAWKEEIEEDKEPYILDSDDTEEPFIARVVQKIIEVHQLPFQFTRRGWLMLSVVAQGNPGMANFVFRRIIQDHPGETLFTEKDVTSSFPHGVDREKFNAWWDGIKEQREMGGENEYEFYRILTLSGIRLYLARLRWWVKNSLARRRLSHTSAR